MNRFNQIKIFLDEAINGEVIGAHRAFWRGLSRNEFVQHRVFGAVPLLVIGDAAQSNLIDALRGIDAFAGRRMPRGFPPMPSDRIDFIAAWIDDGCPEELSLSPAINVDPLHPPLGDLAYHNHYWREFDNWSAWHPQPEVSQAVTVVFGVAASWDQLCRGVIQEADFHLIVRQQNVIDAFRVIGQRMIASAEGFYGNPLPLVHLLESYEFFGRSALPADHLRAHDEHEMNGEQMWFNWATFVDTQLFYGNEADFWQAQARAVLLGLINDGLFRGRFHVLGFNTADVGVQQKIWDHVRGLAPEQLSGELRTRFADTSLTLPFLV